MKRTLATVMAIGLAWCARTTQAEILDNLAIPVDGETYVIECDGAVVDVVVYSGDLHLLRYRTVDATGGVHTKLQFNPTGITGIGLITGNTYQGVGVTCWRIDNTRADGSRVHSFVNQFRLIAGGSGTDYFENMVTHVVFDENGDLKVDVELSDITCR